MVIRRYLVPVLLTIAVAALFTACKKEIPNGGIPAYIQIDTIKVTSNANQGSASHNVTDAWIFVDNEPLGAFQLPCKIPVLKEGKHTILVRGGIKMNGISATRVPYPFYQFYQVDTRLAKDSITVVSPTVTYFPDIIFPYIEDFTSGGVSLIPDPVKSDTDIIRLTSGPDLLQGPCGAIYMPPGKVDTVLYYMNSDVELLGGGTTTYLELDYKNNHPFVMGLYVNNPTSVVQKQLFQFNNSDDWNKIYINLTDYVSAENSALDFKLFFGALKTGEDTTKDVKIFLDNIKLVHN
jgi:hypothetical protein